MSEIDQIKNYNVFVIGNLWTVVNIWILHLLREVIRILYCRISDMEKKHLGYSYVGTTAKNSILNTHSGLCHQDISI